MSRHKRIDELLYAWAAWRDGERSGGYLSGNRSGSARLSRPEAGTHRLHELESVDLIVRSMLSRQQMRLVVARYVHRLPSDRQIAIRLRLNRKYVGPCFADILEQTHKMLPLVIENRRFRHNMLTMGHQVHTMP